MSNFNNILLDWDGNLVCTMELWLQAYKDTFKKFGVDMADEDLVGVFSTHGQPGFFQTLDLETKQNFYKEVVVRAHQLLPEHVAFYPHVISVLNKLKEAGKKLGLVTNSDRLFINHAFEEFSLNALFDVVVTADDIQTTKPNPEGILKASQILNALPDQTLFVGDMATDVAAAKAAGVSVVLFIPHENLKFYKERELLESKPNYIIHDFNELLNIV